MAPRERTSFEAFEKRAEAGDPASLYRLALILEEGYDSIPPDSIRSYSLLRRAATASYPPAVNYLGFLFNSGYIVGSDTILRSDPDSANYYIRLAADLGDPKAASNLAFLLLSTPGVSSSSHSFPPLSPPSCPDAEINSIPRQSCSDDDIRAQAISYLRFAADSGLPHARTMLADIYAEGSLLPRDSLGAVALYEKAVEAGFRDAEVKLLNFIGPSIKSLDSSELVAEAVRYMRIGAHAVAVEFLMAVPHDSPQLSRAYALLGHAYSRGLGVPYDHAKANEYFARAAILGDPAASFIVAETDRKSVV